MLIFLFIRHELSYDRLHPHTNRIYRVLRLTDTSGDNPKFSAGTSGALGTALEDEFPEVEAAVRVWQKSDWVRYKDRVFNQRYCLASANILDFFNFPLVKGDPQTALKTPSGILITQEMAQKYFGDEDPIGKVLSVESFIFGGEYTITGVLQNLPRNATLRFDFLTSTQSRWRQYWEGWVAESYRPVQTYIRLTEGHSTLALKQKLPDFMQRHLGPEIASQNAYHLQPFQRIHLYSKEDYNLGSNGDISTIRVLILIALFILTIACINYMNLATARASSRTKEVGIRKVVGATRLQMAKQFLGESVLLTCVAFICALILVHLTLPTFTTFMNRPQAITLFSDSTTLFYFLGLTLLIGFISGSYPAFFLSAFQPIGILKGTLKSTSNGARLRQGLVVFQFTIAIGLIIATTIVTRQLTYIQNKPLGFDTEHVITLNIFGTFRQSQRQFESTLNKQYNTVKQTFLSHPNILAATASANLPGKSGSTLAFQTQGQTHHMMHMAVDEDFLPFYKVPILLGENFSKTYADAMQNTPEHFIINETAAKQLGWENPIGQPLAWRNKKGHVIGVMQDFHGTSLHQAIHPIVMTTWRPKINNLSLRVRSDNFPETLAFLKKTWKQFLPHRPFDYEFLEDGLNSMYHKEKRQKHIFSTFTFLAVFVSCLGLFALATFTSEQRTKEIGIRKVLGASIKSVILLLSKSFAGLVLAANIIAWPIAYFTMENWLANFTYRIDLGIYPFALGGLIGLTVALLAVCYQAIKAARANPIDALRYE